MIKKAEKIILPISLLFSSNIALAQGDGPLWAIANKILGVIRLIPQILIGLGLVYFFYNLSEYVYALDEKKKKEAREAMLYGILGLFVMVSVWGIVNLVQGALGI